MNKKIGYIFSTLILLCPCISHADLDILSAVQDSVSTAEEEVNKILKQYTGQEISLQELTSSRDIVNKLKGEAEEYAKQQALQYGKSIYNKSIKGLSDNMVGEYNNPNLEKNVKLKYTAKANIDDDVKEMREFDKKINNLLVENTSTMYAKALVTRKKIMNEEEEIKKEEEAEYTDLPQINNQYRSVGLRASGRWKEILSFITSVESQDASSRISTSRLDQEEVKELEQNLEKNKSDKNAQTENNEANQTNENNVDDGKSKGLNLKEAYDTAKNVKDKVDSGDYAGVVGEAGGVAGSYGISDSTIKTINDVGTGVSTAQNAANDINNGNYAGAIGGVANTTGGIIGSEDAKKLAGNIADGVNTAQNAANDINNGNYAGAIDGVANTTGGIIGSEDAKKLAGNIADGANAAQNTKDALDNKNYGDAFNSASDGVKNTGLDKVFTNINKGEDAGGSNTNTDSSDFKF